MVMSARDVLMGYLTAERAPLIGGMIANGREIAAVFQEATSYGAVIRVALDGAELVLPPARPARETQPVDDGFWPDDIYPDD